MTPESSRELADLRRRAYGPDADILGDPDAVRRLRELESQDRSDAPAEPMQTAPVPARDASSTTAAADVPGRPPAAPPSAQAPRPRRRIPVWATITAVGIVGLIAGMAISASIAPRADATLKPLDHMQVDLEDDWLLSISQWMTADAKPTQHEPFHKLQVLSATSEEGTSCLVVTWTDHWSDYSCAPHGIAPVVDFVAYLGGPQPLDHRLPPGSVIRFELKGDDVVVTMRESTSD